MQSIKRHYGHFMQFISTNRRNKFFLLDVPGVYSCETYKTIYSENVIKIVTPIFFRLLTYFYKGNSMKKNRTLLDFIKLTGAGKVTFFRNVIDKLTDNSNFTTPDVSLKKSKSAVDAFETSILAARDGGHTAVANMHANETAADEIFRILAAYVHRVAAGDEAKILSSGFHVSNQPVKPPKAVLAVVDGAHSGSVKLVARAVDKAGAYIWQIAKDAVPDVESGWTMVGTSTRASYDIADLTVTSRYHFRVSAVTPNIVTNFCHPVSKIII
jgi:hypothetical protein